MSDGSILMSFEGALNLSPLDRVSDADIVRFVPTQLGAATRGVFSLYFDGDDVGLTTANEDIDAIALDPNGNLVISTIGKVEAPGVTGQDEDLLQFVAASLGASTTGTWSLLLDGSLVGLTAGSEDVSALWIDPVQGDRYLSTKGKYAAASSHNHIDGDSDDLFGCTPSGPSCIFFAFFDGDLVGFHQNIDGASVDLHGNPSNFAGVFAANSEAPEAVPQFAVLPDAPVAVDAEYDAFDQPIEEEAETDATVIDTTVIDTVGARLFLPLVSR